MGPAEYERLVRVQGHFFWVLESGVSGIYREISGPENPVPWGNKIPWRWIATEEKPLSIRRLHDALGAKGIRISTHDDGDGYGPSISFSRGKEGFTGFDPDPVKFPPRPVY